MQKLTRSTLTACAVLLGGLMVSAGPVAAKSLTQTSCKFAVTGSGTSFKKVNAKTLATNMWKSKVSTHFGGAYANLSKANVLTDQCQPAGKSWHCALTAQPCKTSTVNLSPKAPSTRFRGGPPVFMVPPGNNSRGAGNGFAPSPRPSSAPR